MKIILYKDDIPELDLQGISWGLPNCTHHLEVDLGRERFSIPDDAVKYPKTYKHLSRALLNETKSADLTICATRVPYENNFFYEFRDNLAILSFYAWERLTSLSINNGLTYFVAAILAHSLPLGQQHDETTGCLNDFLWDKTAVDVGMRSGNICVACRSRLETKKLSDRQVKILEITKSILKDLSGASKNEQDIVQYWHQKYDNIPPDEDGFDVFLCHNSRDKEEVREIANRLRANRIRTWLDEEQLRPGIAWQEILEGQITTIRSAAVFVGISGIGPWQDIEIRAFLNEFVRRRCPVIPIILQSATEVPELPIFLRQLTWVDFREDPDLAMRRLLWGITGRR